MNPMDPQDPPEREILHLRNGTTIRAHKATLTYPIEGDPFLGEVATFMCPSEQYLGKFKNERRHIYHQKYQRRAIPPPLSERRATARELPLYTPAKNPHNDKVYEPQPAPPVNQVPPVVYGPPVPPKRVLFFGDERIGLIRNSLQPVQDYYNFVSTNGHDLPETHIKLIQITGANHVSLCCSEELVESLANFMPNVIVFSIGTVDLISGSWGNMVSKTYNMDIINSVKHMVQYLISCTAALDPFAPSYLQRQLWLWLRPAPVPAFEKGNNHLDHAQYTTRVRNIKQTVQKMRKTLTKPIIGDIHSQVTNMNFTDGIMDIASAEILRARMVTAVARVFCRECGLTGDEHRDAFGQLHRGGCVAAAPPV